MHIERGSTWHRWDFHVHTPYSILNNNYGFNPDPNYKTDISEFDAYVKCLFKKAVDEEVIAIGITDYFSIDGYKRIRREYLEKPEKMKELFPDDELREKVEQIYVFPNIEFRIPTFIGKGASAVNYHVIFSDTVSILDIETSFFSQLHIQHSLGADLPLNRISIERIGAVHKQYNPVHGSDYRVGLNQITVDEKEILQVLKNELFKEKYLITIPVDEDLSKKVPWSGRDALSRKILYQQSDCLMTSNANTGAWALGKFGVEEQVAEFGSLKPCIWGSDAHDYDRMFSPADDRFCWLKADPTFEGLRQILYEPEDRVRIQKDRPEEKDEHHIIDHIIFYDSRFDEQPIYFSEGLTAIIGGKSTGKSILLRHIAKCIDSQQVSDREKESSGQLNKLEAKAEVFWKDGVSGERKIIYIPQSWLNRVVDTTGGDTQLNSMIRGILLQQQSISISNQVLSDEF